MPHVPTMQLDELTRAILDASRRGDGATLTRVCDELAVAATARGFTQVANYARQLVFTADKLSPSALHDRVDALLAIAFVVDEAGTSATG